MKGLLARRPSPAMIVALIALVCALTGTAWAALGKNSVGTKQLKSNAVTTAKIKKEAVTAGKIKKGTITGTQINLAKLGTVPAAETANAVAASENWHMVGASGEPSFQGGSSNYTEAAFGAPLQQVGFYKDRTGVVHLKGIGKVGKQVIGSTTFVPVFTLPPGFRPGPNNTLSLFAASGVTTLIAATGTSLEGIPADGQVIGSKEGAVVLDGVTFRAEG
jgi:hypothetical protein